MKINSMLVTGGGGYVGAVLVPKLLDEGYKVNVLDWFIFGRDIYGKYGNHPSLKKIKGDLRKKDIVEKGLKNTDAVIHLACISNDPSFEINPDLGKSINYDATLQLADLAKQKGIKRF